MWMTPLMLTFVVSVLAHTWRMLAGREWLQCSCSRWIHEDCVDDEDVEKGSGRLHESLVLEYNHNIAYVYYIHYWCTKIAT